MSYRQQNNNGIGNIVDVVQKQKKTNKLFIAYCVTIVFKFNVRKWVWSRETVSPAGLVLSTAVFTSVTLMWRWVASWHETHGFLGSTTWVHKVYYYYYLKRPARLEEIAFHHISPPSVMLMWLFMMLMWLPNKECLFVGLVALSFFVFNYFPFLFSSSMGW